MSRFSRMSREALELECALLEGQLKYEREAAKIRQDIAVRMARFGAKLEAVKEDVEKLHTKYGSGKA